MFLNNTFFLDFSREQYPKTDFPKSVKCQNEADKNFWRWRLDKSYKIYANCHTLYLKLCIQK